MRKVFIRIILYIFFYPGLLAGCGYNASKPDLSRLYADSIGYEQQPPVILIHGLLGSRLKDKSTDEEVWMGSLWKLATSSYSELALSINPETLEPLTTEYVATEITDSIGEEDYYGEIMQTLEVAGGFVPTSPGTPVTNYSRRYYVFTYDWRQDNVVTVRKLSRYIEQIRMDYADPDLKIDIIAHSMGGLIARYYLRYGETDVLNDNEFPVNMHGASRIRRIILLGTPNLGSVEAIRSFIAGRKVGFNYMKTEILATMPSIYQLFPHSLNDWIVTASGKTLERDQFDIKIWRQFQWSVFDPAVQLRIKSQFDDQEEADAYLKVLERYFEKQLERARRFVWSLTVPLDNPAPLIVFGGDCHLTPARIVVEEVNGISMTRLWPDEISSPLPHVDYDRLMLEPGDGVVTKASLLARNVLDPAVPRHKYSYFPLDYSFFLCERHDKLTGNISFQDNLLHALLSRDDRL